MHCLSRGRMCEERRCGCLGNQSHGTWIKPFYYHFRILFLLLSIPIWSISFIRYRHFLFISLYPSCVQTKYLIFTFLSIDTLSFSQTYLCITRRCLYLLWPGRVWKRLAESETEFWDTWGITSPDSSLNDKIFLCLSLLWIEIVKIYIYIII